MLVFVCFLLSITGHLKWQFNAVTYERISWVFPHCKNIIHFFSKNIRPRFRFPSLKLLDIVKQLLQLIAFTLWKKNSSNSRLFNAMMSFDMINCYQFCPNNWWLTLLITLAFAKIVALFGFLITNIATILADGLQNTQGLTYFFQNFQCTLGHKSAFFSGLPKQFQTLMLRWQSLKS